MTRTGVLLAATGALLLSACATVPAGPSVQVLPGSRKSFEQFQFDDATCRNFALSQSGAPSDAANAAGVGSAVVGTAIGAAIGGLAAGSQGAAVGAGMGLFTGAAVGTGYAQGAYAGTQQRYDSAYMQCMYAKGNKVPIPGRFAASAQPRAVAPTAAAAPGYAPPPNAAIPPPNTPPPYQLPR